MMKIRSGGITDVEIIRQLAHEIWPVTYAHVISEEQISFMLDKSYSNTAIQQQIDGGHTFLILEENHTAVGFASFSPYDFKRYKLQKLYLHPKLHGKGCGKMMLMAVEKQVESSGASELLLNVNRNNKAKHFYEKMGYHVIETVDIPYFGYVLNDYVMIKKLLPI